MSNTTGTGDANNPQQTSFILSQLPPAAFAGVRSRRIVASFFDLVLVSILSFTVWILLFLLTFGLSILLLPFLPPIFSCIAFFYNGFTVSGWRMATPGMRLLDLEMRTSDGLKVPFLNASIHAILFYISTLILPILIISLLNRDKRCLHDILADIVVTRRPIYKNKFCI